MGEVWSGRHIDQDIGVAVKVIASEQATKLRRRRAFEQEVRSMARLNHPFIIDVVDYGVIDEQTQEETLGQLQQGSPYLVMEHASYGALGSLVRTIESWIQAELILFSLLDALAHSHARGVLHRDIKPQNILLTDLDDSPGVKLTDFGLAYALRDTQTVANWHRAAGTPEYMAPEQVIGDWRQYGPSTDLYAVGCLAYEMLTGHPPFGGDNIVQIADAHLNEPMPPLPEQTDAPTAIESWLQRMLHKEPSQRFETAADAAHELRRIAGPIPTGDHVLEAWKSLLSHFASSGGDEEITTIPSIVPGSPTYSLNVLLEQAPTTEADQSPHSSNVSSDSPRIPTRWQRSRRSPSNRRIVGTGRGVFEMRRLPFFGRRQERDDLWEHFRKSALDEQIGATLLTGPSGVGKDYLARWFCDRVSELGVATSFRVRHEASDPFVDQLALTLRRDLGLDKLRRPQIEEHLASILRPLGATDAYEWKALAELICSAADPSSEAQIHFTSPTQRALAYVHYFHRLAGQKPVVLWFNDVQWGIPALNFVQTLFDQADPDAPIYVVMTMQKERIAENPRLRELLDAISSCERVDEYSLSPLDDETLRRLVDEALFLDPSTAYEVVRRAGGNPRHALEIVGEWLDADVLKVDRHGYSLREDAQLHIPGESAELWARVVDRLAGDCNDTRVVLELGAVLGERFCRSLWQEAAQLMGHEVPESLVDTLLARHYLIHTDQQLSFSQNWLREALFASARTHNRWEQICRICAQALDNSTDRSAVVDERVGSLLLEAGEPIQGTRRLRSALDHYVRHRDYQAMIYLAERGLEALHTRSSNDAILLRVELLCHLSHGFHNLSNNNRALKAARQAASLAEKIDHQQWRGVAARHLMTAHYLRGDIEEAKAEFAIASKNLCSDCEHSDLYAQAFLARAHIAMMNDDYERAFECIDRARTAIEGIDAPLVGCQIEYVSMKARCLDGRWREISVDDIIDLLDRCLDIGATMGAAQVANTAGEYARRRGDLEKAHQWYQRSLELFELVDPTLTHIPRQNLALIALESGKPTVAARRSERVLQQLRRIQRPQLRLYALAIKLPHVAICGDTDSLSSHLDEIDSIIDDLGFGSDPDLSFCLQTARRELRQHEGPDALIEQIEDLLAVVDP